MLYDKVQTFMRGAPRPGFIVGFVLALLLSGGSSWATGEAAPPARGECGTCSTATNVYGSAGKILQTTDAGVLKVEVSNGSARNDAGVTIVAPEGGTFPMSNPVCVNAPQTVVVVGTSAVSVPASPLAGRKVVRVCVSLENVGSPKVKCAIDSHPIMGFVVTDGGSPTGDVMGPGDCYPYPIDTSHTLKCVSDTAGTGVVTWEC